MHINFDKDLRQAVGQIAERMWLESRRPGGEGESDMLIEWDAPLPTLNLDGDSGGDETRHDEERRDRSSMAEKFQRGRRSAAFEGSAIASGLSEQGRGCEEEGDDEDDDDAEDTNVVALLGSGVAAYHSKALSSFTSTVPASVSPSHRRLLIVRSMVDLVSEDTVCSAPVRFDPSGAPRRYRPKHGVDEDDEDDDVMLN